MNNLTLVGRLATDITLDTPKDKPIATFRLAVDRQTGNGTDFIPIKAFGTAAETHARYLTKGRQVAITGRLAHSQWTDSNGNRRERLEVIAARIDYLGKAPVSTTDEEADDTEE
ncbi:MAG: single-stranded DNA-binding protein [Acidimicrobiales bacterium]